MSEEPKVEARNIADELTRLGQQAAEAIKAAWESEDRKKIQAEISEGLQKLGSDVNQAIQKAGESGTAKDLKVKAEKVAVDVKESDVVDEVRKGILSGLDVLNKELGKLLEKLETKPTPPEAPVAPEPPAEPQA